MFNKALTLGQITELALANEGLVAGLNKPKSTILFDDSLILALDFEQEEIIRTVFDVSCNQVLGILYDEYPPTIVEYDKPTTAVKPYSKCTKSTSECMISIDYS